VLFGIDIKVKYGTKFMKGKNIKIKKKYIIEYNKNIANILYLLIMKNNAKYDKAFVDFIKEFNKYDDYVLKEQTNKLIKKLV
jgi:hypothetical protein